MAKLDTAQINKNRRIMAESTVESPYAAVIDDSDADFAERLYNQLPPDPLKNVPPGTEE
jgi:hypothetical protein